MFSRRDLTLAVIALVVLGGALTWALGRSALPPADFTFCNGTEVKSLDPALVSGQPEGQLIYALFEGLVRWHPETLEPLPSGAVSWDVSDDRLVYTFHLRPEAVWSDGAPVTARDYAYGFRRFLDPRTAAEYAFLAWTLKNGRRYSAGAAGVAPGDRVEVELNLPPDAVNTLRGELVRGELVQVLDAEGNELTGKRLDDMAQDDTGVDRSEWTFVIETDGQRRRFRSIDDKAAASTNPPVGVQWCRQVLLDFDEVGVAVVNDLTLRLTLEGPTPYMLTLLGFYPMFPAQQACVEKYGSPQWTYVENLVGNGPFLPEFRRYRDRTRLVRSDTYWDRENVALETVDALAVSSVNTMLNLYLTGETDWIREAPPQAMRELLAEEPPRQDVNPQPLLNTYYYLLNVNRPPLDDVRVRRALALALDRDELCGRILPSGEEPAYSLVPPGLPGYDPPTFAPGMEAPDDGPQRVAEAKQLLAEAGYPEGRGFPRLEIMYNTHESHQLIAEVIRKQWERNLGIVVKSRNEEWGSYLASQRQSRFDICRKGWIGDYADPNTFLDMFVTGGEQNNTNWGRPRYDRLIRDAAAETDPDKRLALLHEAEELLMEELPIIPIYFYMSKNLVKPHVRGFFNNIQDYHPLWAISIDREGDTPIDFIKRRP